MYCNCTWNIGVHAFLTKFHAANGFVYWDNPKKNKDLFLFLSVYKYTMYNVARLSIVNEQINRETLINEFDGTLFAENESSKTQRQCWKGSQTTEH